MRTILAVPFAAAAVIALGVGPALAAVSYDPAAGGTAGKGDVQLALGLNNAALQTAVNNGSIAFSYEQTTNYTIDCIKELKKRTLENTFNREAQLSSSVIYDTKQKKQIVGFSLRAATLSPLEASCPDGWQIDPGDANVTVTSDAGMLKVNGIDLPDTPVA